MTHYPWPHNPKPVPTRIARFWAHVEYLAPAALLVGLVVAVVMLWKMEFVR